jgi:ABC-type branched-subunit amino acid transport system ATPase component
MQIVVTDATIAYGELVVFQHFTASFPSGRVSALVGPSGCGKSSLLAAMAGLQRLNSGEIHIRRDDDPGQARPSPGDVAWVSQGSNGLGARSCVDNVMIAGASGRRSPSTWCGWVGVQTSVPTLCRAASSSASLLLGVWLRTLAQFSLMNPPQTSMRRTRGRSRASCRACQARRQSSSRRMTLCS